MAGNKVDKVLVTNQAALHAKYGSTGVKAIQKAVKRLIAADKKRGLKSVLVFLDDRDAMTEAGGKAVTDAKDPKQNKGAIDAVYKALAPDYLLVLGAEDVVPHQNLQNAMYHPGDPDPDADRDRVAWGDIPYACEAPYSRNPRKFFGATRVVGRLPDLVGARNPSYLLGLLGTASTRKQFAPNSYRPYFGISAEIWKGSTAHSLTNAFGNAADLKTVPASKPKWPRSLLKRRSHFINCHGTRDDSMFYGQPASGESDYPVALDAAYVKGKITEGTVVAAEACYGAQLFDPARNDGQMGIANRYLADKAYGWFGSTTIAYGSDSRRRYADLICGFFFESLLAGASIGRAALEARQRFVHTAGMHNPMNVKTIAQFNLLGDPSMAPFSGADGAPKAIKKISATATRTKRAERRRDLFAAGIALAKSQPTIRKIAGSPPPSLVTTLAKLAKSHDMVAGPILSFRVTAPTPIKGMPTGLTAREIVPDRVDVIFRKRATGAATKAAKSAAKVSSKGVIDIVALVVEEVDERVVSVEKAYSR